MGGQGAAGRPKLRVERQPFLASKAVIFGLNPTGPHIIDVKGNESNAMKLNPVVINAPLAGLYVRATRYVCGGVVGLLHEADSTALRNPSKSLSRRLPNGDGTFEHRLDAGKTKINESLWFDCCRSLKAVNTA